VENRLCRLRDGDDGVFSAALAAELGNPGTTRGYFQLFRAGDDVDVDKRQRRHLGGKTITEEGAAQSSTSRDAVTVDLPPPKAGTGGDTPDSESTDESESDNVSEEALKQREQEQFEDAKEELEETIAGIPQMKQLVESLMIDNTQEGLRIQLVDQDGLAMFPSGSAEMFLHTRRLLELVSKVILKMPQQLSISGHTDAVPFISDTGYSNWELSADRANSARRELQHFDVPEKRIARVVGKSDTEPFLPDDPKNARNRRLSIVLLRGTGEDNPAANLPESQPAGSEGEVLPGLNEIRRRQLQDQAPAALEAPEATISTPAAPSKPSTSFTLELQPRMEAQ